MLGSLRLFFELLYFMAGRSLFENHECYLLFLNFPVVVWLVFPVVYNAQMINSLHWLSSRNGALCALV